MAKEKMNKYYFEGDFSEWEMDISKYHVTRKEYAVGEEISSKTDTLNHGYYIISGIMQLSIGISDKCEQTISFFGPGSIFPIGINEHHYELEYAIEESALTELTAYEFTFSELRNIFLSNQKMAAKMIEHYCDFTSFLFYNISVRSSYKADLRIVAILNSLSEMPLTKRGKLPFSQEEIASMAGSSKIQVARVYKILKRAGVIETQRNQIHVIDQVKLKELLQTQGLDSY